MEAENNRRAEKVLCRNTHTLGDRHEGWAWPRVAPEWRALPSPNLRPLVTKDAGSPSCGPLWPWEDGEMGRPRGHLCEAAGNSTMEDSSCRHTWANQVRRLLTPGGKARSLVLGPGWDRAWRRGSKKGGGSPEKETGPRSTHRTQWEDSALPCDCCPGRWGLARAQALRRPFHLLRLPVVRCSSGSKLNLPPRCEELLRKAVESLSQREKAFRQKRGGKKIRGRGVAAEVGSGLAASDVSEDGVFSRTVGAFRAMGVSGK